MFEEFEEKEVREQMEKNQERLEQLQEQRAQQLLKETDAVLERANAFLAKEKGMTPEEHFEMIQLENAEKDPEYARNLAEEQLRSDAAERTDNQELAEDEEKLNEDRSKPSFGSRDFERRGSRTHGTGCGDYVDDSQRRSISFGSSASVCTKVGTGTQNYCPFAGSSRR